MKNDIRSHIDDPARLEALYQSDKSGFKRAFDEVYDTLGDAPAARFWHERLHYQRGPMIKVDSNDFMMVVILSLLAGFVAKIPDFSPVREDFFYPRNISFIVFPFLITWFAWRQQFNFRKFAPIAAVVLVSVGYINLLPDVLNSDTLMLACIHLPLLMWMVLGFTYTGGSLRYSPNRLDFLRFNGDLVVMGTIILIAGAVLTAITLGLFELINVSITKFYVEYVVRWGLASAPIIATYLVQTNPQLVSRVSPIIAKVFTPLVLITLAVYLIAIIGSGKDPYNDRDFLLIFNALLIGVMALILFSIAESSEYKTGRVGFGMLLALAVVTILVNGVAISAIVFRIAEWGITPNRLAVLGSNVLIFIHLAIVGWKLSLVVRDGDGSERVEESMARFLPVYAAWIAFVVFVFPVLFGI